MNVRVRAGIKGLPKDYWRSSVGRKIQYHGILREFLATARRDHFSAKGISVLEGFRRWRKLYGPVKEYYYVDRTGPDWKDDSVEVWWK